MSELSHLQKEELETIMGEATRTLLNTNVKRVDLDGPRGTGIKVVGYWVGSTLRIDIKGVAP